MAKTGINPGRKTNNAQLRLRIAELADKILLAWQRHEIVEHYTKLWNVSERQIDKYLVHATKLIRITSIEDFDEILKERIALGLRGMKMAYEKGDVRTAATFYSALNRLGGLERSSAVDYVNNNIDLTGAQVVFQLPVSPHALPASDNVLGLQADKLLHSSPREIVAQMGVKNETDEDGLNTFLLDDPEIPGEQNIKHDDSDSNGETKTSDN